MNVMSCTRRKIKIHTLCRVESQDVKYLVNKRLYVHKYFYVVLRVIEQSMSHVRLFYYDRIVEIFYNDHISILYMYIKN